MVWAVLKELCGNVNLQSEALLDASRNVLRFSGRITRNQRRQSCKGFLTAKSRGGSQRDVLENRGRKRKV